MFYKHFIYSGKNIFDYMKATAYHIQINVSDKKSIVFYKQLFSYLQYKTIDEGRDWLGVSNGSTDFWIMETEEKHKSKKFHRKATGINHISFRVNSKTDVDRFVKEFLKKKNIKTLYDSPRTFPQYRKGYYAVFFEDPDRIKLEVTYFPK